MTPRDLSKTRYEYCNADTEGRGYDSHFAVLRIPRSGYAEDAAIVFETSFLDEWLLHPDNWPGRRWFNEELGPDYIDDFVYYFEERAQRTEAAIRWVRDFKWTAVRAVQAYLGEQELSEEEEEEETQ